MSGQLLVTSSDPDQTTIAVPLLCNGIDSKSRYPARPAAFAATRVGER